LASRVGGVVVAGNYVEYDALDASQRKVMRRSVVNLRTNRVRALPPPPAGCGFDWLLDDGRPAWICGDGHQLTVVVGAERTPLPDDFSRGVVGTIMVGRRWIHYFYTDHAGHGGAEVFVSRVPGARSARSTATVVPDLDWPTLFRPMCAPLRRHYVPPLNDSLNDFRYDPWDTFVYDRPFGVTVRRVFELDRCGTDAAVTLAHDVSRWGMAGGIVAWSTESRRRVRAYDARSGRRYAWSVSDFRGGEINDVRVAPSAIVVTTFVRSSNTLRLWTLRLPRR
jgi:hypothetical protein